MIYNFFRLFKPWEIIVIVVISLFILGGVISVISNLTASAEQNIVVENSEDKSQDKEKFEIVGLIPDTRWVKFSGEEGGELYICITHSGEIYEIQKDSDGWVSSKTDAQDKQDKIFNYLYEPPPVFENECWKDINKFPEKVQIEMIKIIYRKDLSL